MHITNHRCLLDVLLVLYLHRPFASHLGKKEALTIPLVRHVVAPLQLIAVGRDKKDSKASRDKLMMDIAE
jgi:1-acyl-sn-glycerol-3-phosphate acyltransferase